MMTEENVERQKKTKLVMYTGGLGPYCEVNGRTFPEKTVVEIGDAEWPVISHRRRFIEVKGIVPLDKKSKPELQVIK